MDVSGVAVPIYYTLSTGKVRPFVVRVDSVWCDNSEWWPFAAAGLELYEARIMRGPRALCG